MRINRHAVRKVGLCAMLVGMHLTQHSMAACFTPQNAEVVIPPTASRVVRYAAREATNFLSRAFGASVPVVTSPTVGKTGLFLGDSEWSRAAGIDVTSFARDEFAISAAGDRVYVAGRDSASADVDRMLSAGGKGSMHFEQATCMGVYEFLERFAGCRFYFPGELGEIVPRRDAVTVPDGDLRVRPDFTSRYLLAWQGEWFEPKGKKEVQRLYTLNYMRLRFETASVPCCHGSNGFGFLERFGKTHPEYFALLSNGERSTDPDAAHTGQLCWTSGVVEEMYKDVRSYLKGEGPEVRGVINRAGRNKWDGNLSGRYVDIMPQDGFQPCNCPRCRVAIRRGVRNGATELIWGVVSNIASRLTREGLDGIVSMMAYPPYRRVPDFPLPPNVEVMVAESGPWSVNFKEQWTSEITEIRTWAEKLGHPVWIWTYPLKFGETAEKLKGVPQVAPRAYADYFKSVAPWIRGGFAECETDRWFFNYLNYYVFSKVCWNNKVDVEALLKEHHELMFGKGAAAMAELYDVLEKKWICGALGSIRDTSLGPQVKPPTDAELWNRVYPETFIAWMDAQCDKARAAVDEGSLEARRVELVRREFVGHLRAASKAYLNVVREVSALRHSLSADADRPIELIPYAPRSGCRNLRTTVWARRAGDDLEVVFDCEEPDMSHRAAITHEPDDPELWQDDVVEVTINPSGDLENYWHVIVNSEGSWADAFHTVLRRSDRNADAYKSNLGLVSKVEKRADGWKATLRIPWKALGDTAKSFPIEFARERHVNAPTDFNGLYHWSKHARGFHNLDNFGRVSE